MTNEIVEKQTFEQKMFAKIRDQIGDLMSEDDLKKIVDQAMKKAFFEERRTSIGYRDEIKPALFVEMMEKEFKSQVNSSINAWIKDNQETMEKLVYQIVNDGIFKAVLNALEQRMSYPLNMVVDQLKIKGIFN